MGSYVCEAMDLAFAISSGTAIRKTTAVDLSNDTGSFDQAGMARRRACGRTMYQITLKRDMPIARPAIICPSLIARMEPRRYSAWYAPLLNPSARNAESSRDRVIPNPGNP